VIYAGYNSNGFGAFSEKNPTPITDDDFNKLLSLSDDDPLRTDFPDTIGTKKFTYEADNYPNQDELTDLGAFVTAVINLKGTTKSGMTAADIERLPFYSAASSYVYAPGYSSTPTALLTETMKPYWSTSYAVWSMMDSAGISGTKRISAVGLGKELLKEADASTKSVLTSAPAASALGLTQNAVFTQKEDKTWVSSPITFTATGISTWFTLNLPGNIHTTNGVTEVKSGETFTLVSESEPDEAVEISVSSDVPWVDGDLRVYKPSTSNYQNMVGLKIQKETMNISTTIRKESETTSISFTKKWEDSNNASGTRPDVSTYAGYLTLKESGNELTNYDPEITDNGDNTYTVTYSGLPKALNGNEAVYSVLEKEIAGYSSDVQEVKDGETLTNTKIPDPTPMPTATPIPSAVPTASPTATASSTPVTTSTAAPATVSPAVSVKTVPKTSAEN